MRLPNRKKGKLAATGREELSVRELQAAEQPHPERSQSFQVRRADAVSESFLGRFWPAKFWRPEKDLHPPNSLQRPTHLMAIQSDRPSPPQAKRIGLLRFSKFFAKIRNFRGFLTENSPDHRIEIC